MKPLSIDHICFAVKDLEKAKAIFETIFDIKPAVEYTSDEEKIRVIRYYVGDVAIELMEGTSPDSDVSRFLEKEGEGFYLISFKVEDVEKGIKELKEKGLKLIDEKPRELLGNRYAFTLKPEESFGCLIEILDGEFKLGKA